MGAPLTYNEVVTFYKVASSGYRGKKNIVDSADVSCIFMQSTGFQSQNFQDTHNSDAICCPDFENDFIRENANRLEGMYILANMFSGDDDASWFKVESVDVNRDHLLNNEIDNLWLSLKKTTPLPGVS